jgi:hypothetical protein
LIRAFSWIIVYLRTKFLPYENDVHLGCLFALVLFAIQFIVSTEAIAFI